MIYYASQMHDVGKIGVPDAILGKNGPLSQPEIEIMRRHTVIGAEILASNDNHLLKMAAQIARHHHECWDGTGYPDNLAGDEIPLAARVVMIADVYDALRSARPYKLPMSHERALEIIVGGDNRTRPGQFDPQLIDLLHDKGQVLAEIYDDLHGSNSQNGHISQKLLCLGKNQELECVIGC
jgi:putative two-component system response regulator